MEIIRKLVLTSLGLLPFLGPVDVAYSAEKNDNDSTESLLASAGESPWRKTRFSLETQTGSRTIGSLDAMIPFMGNDDFMVYANLIAKVGTGAKNKNGSAWEGNLGLGVRRINDNETAIYGAYLFYDYLNSVNENTFTQATIGVERLGMTWDFRANAYIPFGKKSITKNIYQGGHIIIDQHNLIEQYKTQTETVTAGADFEIGRTLGSQQLRGYLAAYSFGKDLTGPRLRFEYQLNQHFALNAAVQYDKSRGTQYLFGARFTVGGAQARNINSIYQRLTSPVVRDIDIVTETQEVNVLKIEKDKFWLVDLDKEETGGAGTIDNPYRSITEALEQAPENAIIFVKGQNTTIDGQATLKNGQILWGGEKTLYWDFDTARPAYAPSSSALLILEGDSAQKTLAGSIRMANEGSIYNFNIIADSDATAGIIVDNSQHVTIENITMSGFVSNNTDSPASAIIVDGGQDIAINNVNLHDNDIGISVNGGEVNLKNSALSSNKLSGLWVTAGNVTSQQNHFNDNLQYGINISGGTAQIIDTHIEGSQINGINITDGTLALTTSKVNNNLGDGISASGGVLTLTNNEINGNEHNGISITGGSTTIINGAINDNKESGMYIAGGESTVNGTTISNSQQQGIDIADGTLILKNATLNNNQENGITINHGSIEIDDSTISNSQQYGIQATGGSITFNHSIVTGSQTDGIKIAGADTTIIGQGGEISDSKNHGLVISEQATANFTQTHFSNNGLAGLESASAISQLDSAIQIDGNFSGDGITVTNNAAGIELLSGTLTLTGQSERSVIDGNTGYGVHSVKFSNTAESTTRNINITDTDIKNTQQLKEDPKTGTGLWAENIDEMTLSNIKINNNKGNGLWIESGKVTGQNISISGNGANNSTEDDLNTHGVGIRVDTLGVLDETKNLTDITFSDIEVLGHLHEGLLINGGYIGLTNLDSSANLDGLMLTNGTVYIENSDIHANKRMGIYIRNYSSSSSVNNEIFRQLTVKDSKIYDQKTSATEGHPSGNGIMIDADSDVELENGSIYNNAGYGVYQNGETSTITCKGTTFNGNTMGEANVTLEC